MKQTKPSCQFQFKSLTDSIERNKIQFSFKTQKDSILVYDTFCKQ